MQAGGAKRRKGLRSYQAAQGTIRSFARFDLKNEPCPKIMCCMMKMRTRKPAASADIGSAPQKDTSALAYIAAQVAKNPPNEVKSCPRLRFKPRRLERA